ncbi:hypothetical protein INS49_012278 [Diaporthe citri]|uniref:uncharacterized protein n=1 Tax=Diaporthe citri TaxID=83186 RepID=UPI001C7E53CD|nr:uncharacterized protein INS49_012278 [Diaporthe citri]KAG6358759.1 hypothetical protein INS49_012278 [Diaporthe citri]
MISLDTNNGILASTSGISRLLLPLLISFISFAVYQLLYHPLRKFPGPLAAKLANAYGAAHVWRRRLHLASLELHETYDIYLNPRVTKGREYIQLRQGGRGAPSLLNTLDKEDHRRKRRVIAPVISEGSMRVFEPHMQLHIDSFLTQLLRSSRKRDIINMTPRCERLGLDVVGELAFGYPLNTQTDPTHRVIMERLKTRSDRSALYFFWPLLRLLESLFNVGRGRHSLNGFYGSLKTMIATRMAFPKDDRHDFYSLASRDISPGEPGLISKDLWAEAVLFIAADGSTTSTALSGMFFYLSRNPKAYARLASEIRTAFTSAGEIRQGLLLNSCTYLRCKTASAAAGEPFIVDGHVIPPGTQVAVSQYSLQHNPKYFPDPFEFRPERWLAPESEDGVPIPETAEQRDARTAMRRAFMPFSIGDRSCAGKSMAYLEMRLTIAKTFWYFDFEKAPGEAGELGGGWAGRTDSRGRRDEFQLYDSIAVDHTGPNVVFLPRGRYYEELSSEKVWQSI